MFGLVLEIPVERKKNKSKFAKVNFMSVGRCVGVIRTLSIHKLAWQESILFWSHLLATISQWIQHLIVIICLNHHEEFYKSLRGGLSYQLEIQTKGTKDVAIHKMGI